MQAYTDTLKYLESLTNYELIGLGSAGEKFDLGKLKKVLEETGNPHRAFRSIHVAGTKGKGSICSFVSTSMVVFATRFTTPSSCPPKAERETITIANNTESGVLITGV